MATMPAVAAAQDSTLLAQLLADLRPVPTFCIVNKMDGASYMLKQNADFARGYAFTTESGAQIVLDEAVKAAEQQGTSELWKDAVLTVVPADIAVRLALQPNRRTTQKDTTMGAVVELIPDATDRETAMRIDKGLYKEQGKVPLFYFDNVRDEQGRIQLFFRKSDATNARGGALSAPPGVIDLVTLFQYVVRGLELPTGKDITFVPNPVAVESAQKLRKAGIPPYNVQKMII